jgi:uncharacterized membrane protein YeaQ/YmgE (transglycosylase-associated protein family)
MAVLGWIALGLAAGVLASGVGSGERRGAVLAGRCATGMAGAVLAGLVATAAGVGSIDDFFDTAAWLIALGGAVLALLALELATSTRGRSGAASPAAPPTWTGPATRESDTFDRNW